MKKFTSILATALIAASLFLSSPFPASGDNSLTKIIHFQKTDPSTRSISDADLPLFIDLIDSYNQRTYYSLKYKGSNVKLSYPDDKVSGFPISDLENLVYASTSISDFRQKLENYIVEHPSIGNGMTEENLEILFESYE